MGGIELLITFECARKNGNKIERWTGIIPRITDHGNHYEIRIESRSGIMVIFGKVTRGGFACMPDHGVGCHLASLNDKYWNTESLVDVLGEIDGITVAEALYSLRNTLNL
jgi:hypothetical protein